MPGQERQSLCRFCVAGLPLHDGGVERYENLAKSDKAYVASVLQGFHCIRGEGIEAVQGQERKSLCCLCVSGLPLHDGEWGGVVPGHA